jgi:HK97 family phage major capsid protein
VPDKLKIGRQFLSALTKRESVNLADRTVELAISSEQPVERWWGIEILSHEPGDVDLGWLSSGRAPLLLDHDTGQVIGVIVKAWLGTDKVLRALARFSTSPLAEQVMQDSAAGIRVNISVGYQINELTLVEMDGDPDNDGDAEPTYRAKWTPLEASYVAIPADMTVGVGRDAPDGREVRVNHRSSNQGNQNMETEQQRIEREAREARERQERQERQEREQREAAERARAEGVTEATKAERQRIADILALGQRHNKGPLAQEHVEKGTSLAAFRGIMLENLSPGTALEKPQTDLGLSEKEARAFSFVKLIAAQARQKIDGGNARDVAPFEVEAHAEIEKRLGKPAQGFYVPLDAQRAKFKPVDERGLQMAGQRSTLAVGTNSLGGYTVATELVDFIDLLRNQMMTRAMGARVLTGLVGNVAFPKMTAAGTAYWVGESGTPTGSNQTFGQVTMSPKTVAGYVDMSRLLLKQSSLDVEMLVRTDLSEILAIAADLAALHGSGSSNQPTGIAATSGIGSVAGGTNGAAPTWPNIVALETAVAVANAAIGNTGYLTNPSVRGKLKTTDKTSGGYGQFIWPDTPMSNGMGQLNGYKAGATNQVSSTLTKGTASGVCSAIFFGNWADLMIGEWGVLDILVNPYQGATAGDVRVHAFMSLDIAVRRAASFAAMLDALTS